MMSKKNHYPPSLIKVANKAGDVIFPDDYQCARDRGRLKHVLKRELPNPTAALVVSQPSERAYLRAATLAHDQQQARARREALAILEREESRRDEIAHAARRRPLGAPMATRIGSTPDPFATLAWEAIVADARQEARVWWGKWAFTAALAIWSAACFLLGTVA